MNSPKKVSPVSTIPVSWKDSGLRWYWVAGFAFVADQLSKLWVLANFELSETVQLLPFFNFTYVRNYGAAFSFLSDAGGWQRWFFTVIALGFSTLLTLWLRKQSHTLWRTNLAFTLVIGGALGNLVDRLYHGYVVDFLHFYWQSYHFPAFNIADSAIFIGAVLIIWDSFKPQEASVVSQDSLK